MKVNSLSLEQIRKWLDNHQRRLRMGDDIPTMSELAEIAGISRQTLYKFMKGERSEFGEVAQIRLSRMLMQVSEKPNYSQTNLARIDFASGLPKIKFGV